MLGDVNCLSELREKTSNKILEKKQLHDVTTLAAELKRLLVRHQDTLKDKGVGKEMQQLEDWLEVERKGPAPASIISEGGVAWLEKLRDRLKLSADEMLRLESEGGNPSSQEQIDKTEDLLKAIRRIDRIIDESSVAKPH